MEWLRRRWNNPLIRGLIIAILAILIGKYVIPPIEYIFTPPQVEVVYPVSGEAVYWHERGSAVIGNHWKLQQNHIYVLMHPADTPLWFVQPQATPLSEDMWRATVYYGTEPEESGSFEILALMTTTKLIPGEIYVLDDLQGLQRESTAISNVVTVTKVPTCTIETGTIEVTSNPPAAPFRLAGPASYSGVTPWVEANAPVGAYTIIWGSMNDRETPTLQTTTLPQAEETISFHVVYREATYTYRLTINTSGQGGTEPSQGTHTYDEGTPVTITAIPAPDCKFDHWAGDATGKSTSLTIIMNSDKSVTACFKPEPEMYIRECEDPDESDIGQMTQRTNASGSGVHGQFGCESFDPWTARAGYVKYNIAELHSGYHLYLVLRYSKSSPSTTPIRIYLDEETQPRAVFIPNNQGSWEEFTETEPIDLGQITAGAHTIKFSTDGQLYGVADLDKFTCSYLLE